MIYISISTIPSRIKNLNKSVQSLLKQTRKPDKILLMYPINTNVLTKLLKINKFLNLIIILLKLQDVKIADLEQNY